VARGRAIPASARAAPSAQEAVRAVPGEPPSRPVYGGGTHLSHSQVAVRIESSAQTGR
jgi:hypothetical protein